MRRQAGRPPNMGGGGRRLAARARRARPRSWRGGSSAWPARSRRRPCRRRRGACRTRPTPCSGRARAGRARVEAEAAAALERLRDARRGLENERTDRLERDVQQAQCARRRRCAQAQEKIARGGRAGAGCAAARSRRRRGWSGCSSARTSWAAQVAGLEGELDRMARDARRGKKDAARQLQEAADAIRDRKLQGQDPLLEGRGEGRARRAEPAARGRDRLRHREACRASSRRRRARPRRPTRTSGWPRWSGCATSCAAWSRSRSGWARSRIRKVRQGQQGQRGNEGQQGEQGQAKRRQGQQGQDGQGQDGAAGRGRNRAGEGSRARGRRQGSAHNPRRDVAAGGRACRAAPTRRASSSASCASGSAKRRPWAASSARAGSATAGRRRGWQARSARCAGSRTPASTATRAASRSSWPPSSRASSRPSSPCAARSKGPDREKLFLSGTPGPAAGLAGAGRGVLPLALPQAGRERAFFEVTTTFGAGGAPPVPGFSYHARDLRFPNPIFRMAPRGTGTMGGGGRARPSSSRCSPPLSARRHPSPPSPASPRRGSRSPCRKGRHGWRGGGPRLPRPKRGASFPTSRAACTCPTASARRPAGSADRGFLTSRARALPRPGKRAPALADGGGRRRAVLVVPGGQPRCPGIRGRARSRAHRRRRPRVLAPLPRRLGPHPRPRRDGRPRDVLTAIVVDGAAARLYRGLFHLRPADAGRSFRTRPRLARRSTGGTPMPSRPSPPASAWTVGGCRCREDMTRPRSGRTSSALR